MTYKAVLFDLDGTLLDTLEDLADSANHALAEMQMPEHSVDAYRYFVGDGMMTLIERIVPEDRRNKKIILDTVEAFRRHYTRNWYVKTRPYAGIGEMLTALVEAGLQLAILSNKPQDFTELCVERLLGDFSFAPVLGQREGIPKKPDPAGALEIAESLNIAPGRFLYLGDTSIDMHTAGRAGMCAVGVLWGFRTESELRDAGAEHLIQAPADLLDLLE
ncbi:MAG: HAD family hydrolase [Desulfobulbaceae bacterium]|nr:HAD family hydrolase [Desulfobulbaceae bacterium]